MPMVLSKKIWAGARVDVVRHVRQRSRIRLAGPRAQREHGVALARDGKVFAARAMRGDMSANDRPRIS